MKVKEIINIIDGDLLCGSYDEEIEIIKQDSREIQKGDTFITFNGENIDGSKFIDSAIQNGARIVITSNKNVSSEKATIIAVNDTQKALEDIISYKLESLNINSIAITGSVGKTSTKELIYEILKNKYKVFKSEKNFNSTRGLPLTCSKITDEEFAVLELGMSGFNEISTLSKMVKPKIAVITNIGSSHVGKLGSRENILKAKYEITDGLRKDGFLILNYDNDLLNLKIKELEKIPKDELGFNLITFGFDENADYSCKILSIEDDTTNIELSIFNNKFYFKINAIGLHNIYNALASIVVAHLCKLSNQEIQMALSHFSSTQRRLEKFITQDNMIVFDDTYNASYESIKAAIEYISLKNYYGRKVYILGDVLEIDGFEDEYYQKIADVIIKNDVNLLITAGNFSKKINEYVLKKLPNLENYHFENSDEVIKNLNLLKEDDIILIKASNSMNFSKIADELKKKSIDTTGI